MFTYELNDFIRLWIARRLLYSLMDNVQMLFSRLLNDVIDLWRSHSLL